MHTFGIYRVYWQRIFDSNDFDYQKVGWHYEVKNAGGDATIYDTTHPGYGNGGHFMAIN